MPREYRHIKEYAKEILELREQGLTKREIGEKFGLSKEQIKGFLKQERRRQKRLACGILPKKKGRPAKDNAVTEDKIVDLRYKLARKEAGIKQLEMENELMRDFLLLTERK